MAMTKDQFQGRLEGLNKAIEQSLANHNALVGRKLECEDTIKHLETLEQQAKAEENAPVAQ